MKTFWLICGVLILADCASTPAGKPGSSLTAGGAADTLCIRTNDAADKATRRLMTAIETPGARRVPPYVPRAVAGEIAIRLSAPFSDLLTHSGVISFVVYADGTAEPAQVDSVGDHALDSAIVGAIREAGASQQFAFQSPDRGKPPVPIRLRMWTEVHHAGVLSVKEQLFGERVAEALPGNPSPMMPANAERNRVGDQVTAEFTLNEAGRPEAGSLKLRAEYQEYAAAVRAILPFMRYRPAEIQGCPARIVQHQRFEFVFLGPHPR